MRRICRLSVPDRHGRTTINATRVHQIVHILRTQPSTICLIFRQGCQLFFFRKLWENRENLILAFQCGSLTDGFVVFNTICQIVTNESDMMAPLSPSVAKADIFAVQKVYSHHIFTCPALAHSEDQHDTSPPLWRHCRFHIGYRSSEIIIPIVRIGGGICFKNIPPFAILN